MGVKSLLSHRHGPVCVKSYWAAPASRQANSARNSATNPKQIMKGGGMG